MDPVLNVKDVVIGFHPAGYRIDKTASPMNRYTKWNIIESHWCNPKPVCFDSLPQHGWFAKDRFDLDEINMKGERNLSL
jgi:hypothetical protein